ncbi:sensor histidine kinase [Mycoplasma sp. P36-A1]|uniref:sensor histidine kinase n=1 Tax=Mycoplasma sp. P36-A1 TaxID=3252900 RepID=UPI003C2CE605
MIVDVNGIVQSYNAAALTELGIDDFDCLPADFDFISVFTKSNSIHMETEIKVNENFFFVSISKFKSAILNGAFINFTNITYIKESQELQQSFLQNASHELKTPIAAIQGICELLLDGKVTDKQKQMDFINVIAKENSRLKGIIADLTSNNERLPIYTTFSLEDMFKDIKLFYQNYHVDNQEPKNINIELNNELNKPIRQDQELVRQILINLIENAYKYTDEGLITVSAQEENDLLRFSVKDTGIGIEFEDIKNIFNRFYRVDKSRSRETGGSGLGLSIVKEIVESLGGTIEVSSEVNKGTEFIIYLRDKK